MITSSDGLNIIEQFEGLRLKAYQDSVGVWTIGYGHTENVASGQIITQSQAEDFLQHDVTWAEDAANLYLGHAGLHQHQFDALVSLVFNVGAGAIFTRNYGNGYPRGSKLFNLILLGKLETAAKHFNDFVYAGNQILRGLVIRRKAEQALFSKYSVPKIEITFWSRIYQGIFQKTRNI